MNYSQKEIVKDLKELKVAFKYLFTCYCRSYKNIEEFDENNKLEFDEFVEANVTGEYDKSICLSPLGYGSKKIIKKFQQKKDSLKNLKEPKKEVINVVEYESLIKRDSYFYETYENQIISQNKKDTTISVNNNTFKFVYPKKIWWVFILLSLPFIMEEVIFDIFWSSLIYRDDLLYISNAIAYIFLIPFAVVLIFALIRNNKIKKNNIKEYDKYKHEINSLNIEYDLKYERELKGYKKQHEKISDELYGEDCLKDQIREYYDEYEEDYDNYPQRQIIWEDTKKAAENFYKVRTSIKTKISDKYIPYIDEIIPYFKNDRVDTIRQAINIFENGLWLDSPEFINEEYNITPKNIFDYLKKNGFSEND